VAAVWDPKDTTKKDSLNNSETDKKKSLRSGPTGSDKISERS